jgi:hypothetical protein
MDFAWQRTLKRPRIRRDRPGRLPYLSDHRSGGEEALQGIDQGFDAADFTGLS